MLQKVAPVGSAMTLSWRSKGKAQQVATCLIAKTIALLRLPLSIMKSQAFHWLLHFFFFFASWYNLPSWRTLSSRVLPSLYDSVREVVRDHFTWVQRCKVHFTVDLWSGGQHSYLLLTAPWWH